jgi:protein required for attachment to host cells
MDQEEKPMKITWILVADSERARVFVATGAQGVLEPALPQDFVHGAAPSREIASDRQGRVFDRFGPGRHAAEEPTDPHRFEIARFAREIVHVLDGERKRNAFERLVVIAPPTLLGDLRAAMPDPLRSMVAAELDQDLAKLPARELADRVRALLKP